MKRKYTQLAILPVSFYAVGSFLVGSKTSVSIKVNEVEVEDYHQGFGTDATNDFQEVSFD